MRHVRVCVGLALSLAGAHVTSAHAQATCGDSMPIRVALGRLPLAQREPGSVEMNRALRDSANNLYARALQADADSVALATNARALDAFERAGLEDGATATLSAMGREYIRLGHPDSAAFVLRRACALQIAREKFASYLLDIPTLSEVYATGLHDPARALALTTAAREVAQDIGDFQSDLLIAAAQVAAARRLGRADVVEAAQADLGRLGPRAQHAAGLGAKGVLEARMLVLSAQIFGDGPTLNGDARAQARRDLMRALQLFRQAGDSLGEADGLAALGLDYARFAQYDSARAILRRALDLATVGGASRVQQAGLRLTAAQIERQAGRSPSTIVPALEGVAADARGVVGASVRAKAYFTLAEALVNAGRLTESNAALQQAVATQRTRALALTAADREDLGEAFLRLGDVDSARFYLLAADRQDGTANDWRRHALLAQVYRQARPPLFHEAVAHYDSATVAIADRARNAQSDEERIRFADQFAELGRNWVLTWLDRAGRDMDSATVAAASWAAANRVRAPSLVSNLGDLVATIVVPQSDRELADEFERTMRWLGVFGAMPAAVLSYLTTRDTTVVWLGRPGEKMLVARVPVGRDSLAALDAGLRTLIGADTAATRMAPSDDSPAAPARRTATVSDDEDVRAALDRILLPETIRTALPDSGLLLVLPDGATGRVPIAMLRIDAHTQVVDRFAVQLMPSIAALGALAEETGRRRAAPLPSERSVVVGDPQMPTRRTPSGATKVLDSLPEALAEADSIARWLGARALTGPRATAAAVIAALPRAPIVHLATHAVAYGSRDRVGSSYIALAPATRSTRLLASGFLTLDDVMSDAVPRLHADLVMLSACQTALGQLSDSEGIVGFARAFLAKGASSVIVSQWSVNSRASAALSEAFYAHWLRDPDRPSKAEALRRAQRKLRESPEFARARDWASFVLVGAP